MVQFLLENNIDIEAHSRAHNGATAFYLAAFCGEIELMELLYRHKADIHARTDKGTSPLMIACYNGHYSAVNWLLQHGCQNDVQHTNDLGFTPLHYAAKNGHCTIAKLLLSNGADINFRDKEGKTPLTVAVINGELAVASCLVQQKASVDVPDLNGMTALHHASASASSRCVQFLLKEGANIHALDNKGNSVLHSAVSMMKKDLPEVREVIELFLQKGFSIKMRNNNNETIMDLAKQRHLSLISFLKQKVAQLKDQQIVELKKQLQDLQQRVEVLEKKCGKRKTKDNDTTEGSLLKRDSKKRHTESVTK